MTNLTNMAAASAAPATAKNLWAVEIQLPRDRKKTGVLYLYDHTGKLVFSANCLGRSAGHISNPTRNPLRYRGDTPLGRYEITFLSRLATPIRGIGDIWVGLDPHDFYDSQARQAEQNGRSGIGIHGGRGNVLLKPTHGCVRLLDRDMGDFLRVAGKRRFTVNITEVV